MSADENYVVQQGDTLVSIAHAKGYRSWVAIWDHPGNAALRAERHPQVLFPGDQLLIPAKQPKEFSAPTDERSTFTVKRLKANFRLKLVDEGNRPLCNKRYELVLEDQTLDGQTSGDAVVELAIPPDAKKGKLTVWMDGEGHATYVLTWNLNLGKLDPIDTTSGIQARLINLGFLCGSIDGDDKQKTTDALTQFQIVYGLDVTGAADAATQKKLIEAHDRA